MDELKPSPAAVRIDFNIVSRDFLEREGFKSGNKSAINQALKDADEYDGEVRFWLARHGDLLSIMVQKF
tara:strand:+ start:2394 stop:2600 length:207 start_codon:yes stop_codon:yes gene_type:complete